MTWRTDGGARRRAAGGEAGFTLLEMIVVVAVLGLVAALFAMQTPGRSGTLDLRAVAAEVQRTMRAARGQAIASNRRLSVVLDMTRRQMAMEGGPVRDFPPTLSVLATGEAVAPGRVRVVFAPDGSSSGGQVDLAIAERRARVTVDWLTGRTSVSAP